MVLIPSILCGKRAKIRFKRRTKKPAKKPASKAPKKPELTNGSLESAKEEKVVPVFAIAPPTKPTTKPGRSANPMAI